MISQKHVFWQAFVLAAIIFAIGIFLGFSLENLRSNEINKMFQQSELDLLDIRIQNDLFELSEINCEQLIQENIDFANKIYQEAQILDRYEEANKLSDSIILQHKKYDLLRTLFWANAIKIKEKCNASFSNIVYLYQYNNPSLETKAKQEVFSRILSEVKQEKGNSVMLIPIAADNDLSSINLMLNLHNVSLSELPIILIDEKIKISDVENKQEIFENLPENNFKILNLN